MLAPPGICGGEIQDIGTIRDRYPIAFGLHSRMNPVARKMGAGNGMAVVSEYRGMEGRLRRQVFFDGNALSQLRERLPAIVNGLQGSGEPVDVL